MAKALIFDSSSIISLALNNLLPILQQLKNSKIKFLITPHVKNEIIDRPLKIKRFELESLMLLDLLNKGVLEIANHPNLERETQKVLQIANSTYSSEGKDMNILQVGEASCFAFHNLMKDKGCDCILAMDERTARMLSENPENLRLLFESKLHRQIAMKKDNADYFGGVRMIRSVELAVIAFKKKLIQLPAPPSQVIDALLFGLKLKGCSISYNEIEQVKKMFR